MSNAQRYAQIEERFPGIQHDQTEDHEDWCDWWLIERNRKTEPPFWFSAHADMEDAGNYITGQEYADDWEPVVLIHAPTGAEYEAIVPEPQVQWTRVDPA